MLATHRIVRISTRFSRSLLSLHDLGNHTVLSTNNNVPAGALVLSSPVPVDEIGSRQDKHGKRSMQIGKEVHWDIRGQKTFPMQIGQHLRGQTSPHIIKFAFHANDPNCRLDVVTPADGSGETWVIAAEEDFSDLASKGKLFVNMYARRHISVGSLVTYNFNSYEENLGEENRFTCMFSRKDVKGFDHLGVKEKQAIFDSGIAFPHIAAQAPTAKKVGLKDNGDFGKALATFQPLKIGDIAMINHIQPHELVKTEDKNMHSIQIGTETHWDNAHPQHLIKMGQHTYDPSCRLDIMTYDTDGNFVTPTEDQYLACAQKQQLFIVMSARRDLNPGDLLTYNYNSFEDSISCTFIDAETNKLVGGFPMCDGEESSFLIESGIAFPHIQRMAQRGWIFEGSRVKCL